MTARYQERDSGGRIIDLPNYTIRAAATRTGKTVRTIERWLEQGMRRRYVAGQVIIDHPDLIAALRHHALSNPTRRRQPAG